MGKQNGTVVSKQAGLKEPGCEGERPLPYFVERSSDGSWGKVHTNAL